MENITDPILQDSSDEHLIRHFKGGKKEAFDLLYYRHLPKVYKRVRYVVPENDVEDVTQEIFIATLNSLSSFRGDAKFSTWLYRITHFHCLDILKSSVRKKTESWEALVENKGEKAESLLPQNPPRHSWEQSENLELLTNVLSHLPEKSRTVIILREIQSLSYEEIASTLTCTLDAVKSRLRRARQELAEVSRHLPDLDSSNKKRAI